MYETKDVGRIVEVQVLGELKNGSGGATVVWASSSLSVSLKLARFSVPTAQ